MAGFGTCPMGEWRSKQAEIAHQWMPLLSGWPTDPQGRRSKNYLLRNKTSLTIRVISLSFRERKKMTSKQLTPLIGLMLSLSLAAGSAMAQHPAEQTTGSNKF